MSGIDIDWIRAEFPAPHGTGQERAQIELILRLCDEVERLWGEAQWHDLRGAVVGGMVAGLVDRKQVTIDRLDAAGRSLARELVNEIRKGRRDRDSLALAQIAAGESVSVQVVADLGVVHLGRRIIVDGLPRGRLLAFSSTQGPSSHTGGPTGQSVHLSTEIGDLDTDLSAPCSLVDPHTS